MKGFLERELKLDPGESFALPALPGRPLEVRVFTSTYYDTPPRSLARGGITLRRRVENGLARWQLKLPREEGRDELEAPGGPAGPPPELRALLKAHLRHGRLEPVATLRTHRSGVRVADGDRPLADVTVDAVDVLDHGRPAGGFTELEVELVDGDEADLIRLSRVLRRAGARLSDGQPKLMRVLQLAEERAPAPDAPVDEQLRFLLGRQFLELEAQDPPVRLGEDIEAVHRFRVATRRARALIRTTRPLLGNALVPLAAELRWLTDALGPVRDLDVLLQHLRDEVAGLDVDSRGGEAIVASLQEAREECRDVLLAALATSRYSALLGSFEAAVDSLTLPDGGPAVEALAAHAFERLRRAARRLAQEPADAELHRLRILGKRARYAAELAAVRGDGAIGRFVTAAKQLQDVVGEHQDAVVAEARIRAAAGRRSSSLAAGRLVERERARRHASAGDRTLWDGDDRERPLDERGVRQAAALVPLLVRFEPALIVTSPYLRCRQTVEPLGEALGCAMEVREELGEERQFTDGAALVASLVGTTAVICGHGGLEQAVVGSEAPRWRKAATLVLDDDLRLVEQLARPK
jgi:CHAD domain-containing protein/phosphohistidine phosphatase SixA